jgi:hypothetical protein
MRGGPRAAPTAWAERYHRSASRPQRVERPQWPYRRHLRGKGCMKAAERGGNGVRAASKAWEQAHRHLCVNVCPRCNLGRRGFASETCLRFFPSRQISAVPFGVQLGLNLNFRNGRLLRGNVDSDRASCCRRKRRELHPLRAIYSAPKPRRIQNCAITRPRSAFRQW